MCDYSLHAIQSRPARTGDVLVTSEFALSLTRGFSADGTPEMAVCLLPGTELAFSQDAECDHPFAKLFPAMRFGSIGARLARFRQINQGLTNTHRDALEFANGRVVLLTKLRPGQRAKVLQLPAQADPDKKPLETALIDVVLSDAGAAASFGARQARRSAGVRQAIEGATAGERK